MIIYKITNKINNKAYIGQTSKSLELRWKQHCQLKRKKSCPLLLKAIVYYGQENFSLEILENCESKQQLNKREAYWVAFYNTFGEGYNLTSGGDRVELAEESKQKIRQKLLGRPRTDGKGFQKGATPWNKGKAWSQEMKNKLSLAHGGSGKPKEHKSKDKAIVCIETTQIFKSGKEAAKQLNLQPSKICLVLKGHRKHTGGYSFVYLTNDSRSLECRYR